MNSPPLSIYYELFEVGGLINPHLSMNPYIIFHNAIFSHYDLPLLRKQRFFLEELLFSYSISSNKATIRKKKTTALIQQSHAFQPILISFSL